MSYATCHSRVDKFPAFAAVIFQRCDALGNVRIILRGIKHGYETSCDQVLCPGD
jgi:hypothetical protein